MHFTQARGGSPALFTSTSTRRQGPRAGAPPLWLRAALGAGPAEGPVPAPSSCAVASTNARTEAKSWRQQTGGLRRAFRRTVRPCRAQLLCACRGLERGCGGSPRLSLSAHLQVDVPASARAGQPLAPQCRCRLLASLAVAAGHHHVSSPLHEAARDVQAFKRGKIGSRGRNRLETSGQTHLRRTSVQSLLLRGLIAGVA